MKPRVTQVTKNDSRAQVYTGVDWGRRYGWLTLSSPPILLKVACSKDEDYRSSDVRLTLRDARRLIGKLISMIEEVYIIRARQRAENQVENGRVAKLNLRVRNQHLREKR